MSLDTPKYRPYQLEDIAFLSKLECAACFNEQRTGKTPVALGVVAAKHLENERILIITTKSALFQWQYEYERWLHKPCVVATGTPLQKQKIIKEQWTHGLIICLSSFKKTKNNKGCEALIVEQKPSMVILDEAHYISNPQTCAAESVYKLIQVPNRLALTGTPVYSKPDRLYGILHFLFPTKFHNIWPFRNNYLQPLIHSYWTTEGLQIKKDWSKATFSRVGTMMIQNFLKDVATQRKRKEVMQWLPEKDRQVIYLPLTKQQDKYLNELMETFQISGSDVVVRGVLDRLVRYRQICVDPKILNLNSTSPKTEWILDFISENPDTPVIIFSNFTEYLKKLFIILKENSIKLAMIIGDVDPKKRMKFQEDFQNRKFNVFLINTSAGKEALTLDRAEVIIFTDVFHPIGAVLQAEDRFVATTEDKKDKPHTIYYLTMKDSFEENILTALNKQKTAADVINDFKAQLKIKEDGL